MEMKSVSGFTCLVEDIAATAAFYERLGFRFGDQTEATLRIYLNWFSINFQVCHDEIENKANGMFVNIKVENIDAFYQDVLKNGFKPMDEPKNMPNGNREFVLRDPDGYQLVFFQKAK